VFFLHRRIFPSVVLYFTNVMKKYFLGILVLIVSICLAWPSDGFARGGGRGGGSRGGSRGGGHHVSSPSHHSGGHTIRSGHPAHHPHHPYRGPYYGHRRHYRPYYARWWVSAPYCSWWDYYCGPFWSWPFYGYYGSVDVPVFMFEDADQEEGMAYYPIAPLPDVEEQPEGVPVAPEAIPANPLPGSGSSPP